ncbi:MAG: DegT/DnrJ/EryC1/StrS family aminotransferase [Nitrospira sp.]
MERAIPFHLPDIGEEEIQAVTDTLRSGWLTTGERTKQFEQDFAQVVRATHAVATNSGTAALHLALRVIGVKEGDEVILPTMTFAATAEVVSYVGAKPVLVDSQPDTLNMDPDAVMRAITPRTKVILPVHFAGHACEMDRLLQLAAKYNLRVVEDAAHAFPAAEHGRIVGGIGDITCFSFYATKSITTGEGGMATTQHAAYAERMRSLSLHGITKDAWNRYAESGSWYYEIREPGFKYNLTDIAAAIGIEQLRKYRRMWAARCRIAAAYQDAFEDLPELQRPVCRPDYEHAWHLYTIQLRLDRLRITRNGFIEALKKAHIGASVHFIPLHMHPYYRETSGYRPDDFPRARAAYERMVSLPIYSRMSDADTKRVIEVVRTLVKQYRQ